MSDKSELTPSSSHPVLFFVAGALAGAAAVVLLLPETRERARSLVKKTVEEIKDGNLTSQIGSELGNREHQTKKAMKAGWEAFINTLAQEQETPAPPAPEN